MIVDILTQILGKPNYTSDQNHYKFNCPKCRKENGGIADNKYNLEVKLDNTEKQYKYKRIFHCWKCGYSGYVGKLIRYFGNKKQLKKFELLDKDDFRVYQESIKEFILPELPEGFFQITQKTREKNKELDSYLNSRKIYPELIHKFNIGITYKNPTFYKRLILPSYDANGDLNFYTGRDYSGKQTPKYVQPKDIERAEVIINEQNISWDDTVFLTEGFFDMYAFPINTIPTMSNVINKAVKKKLYIYKPNVILLYDNDTFKKNSKYTTTINEKNIKDIKQLGIKNIKSIKLPLNDLGQYLDNYGKKSIDEIYKIIKKSI